jgi:SPP1 gp7 family putative phage head morphogenesis protein
VATLDGIELDYNSPDNLRIAMFRANVYHFSAASSFAECIELRQLLEESNYDWPAFKRAVQDKGLQDLRLSYLRTEYNHAIAASQNAANWYRQQADKDLFDLQYRAVLDDRTRSEHAALNGLTARADDPVWNTIYPPNGWNCRCEVIQVTAVPGRADATLDAGLVNEAVKPDFRFNFGDRGQIFQNGLRVFDKFPEEKTLNRRKYGLPDWAQLDRTALAEPALGDDTKAAYLQWWDRQVMAQGKGTEDLYFKDYSGLHVRLPKSLRTKFDNDRYRAKGEDRWAMAPMVADIVGKADEVWVQFNNSSAALKTTYLRNYNDRTYAVVVETTDALDVITWYPVKPQELGKQRSGILLKR